MNNKEVLNNLSKAELIELIELYAKNWLALDGVWFQSIENECGMEEAIFHDKNAWERFTVIEAKRIKDFLILPEQAGLDGLAKALQLRFYGSINEYEFLFEENKLIFRNVDCRVQTARKRKGMDYHPCKPVGIVEYEGFAKTIDNRIECHCLSCFPDATDDTACCVWEFTLNPQNS